MIATPDTNENLTLCMQRTFEVQQQFIALTSELYSNAFHMQTVMSNMMLNQCQELLNYWGGDQERLTEKWANQINLFGEQTQRMSEHAASPQAMASSRPAKKHSDAYAKTGHELKSVGRQEEESDTTTAPLTKAEKALASNKRHVTSAA